MFANNLAVLLVYRLRYPNHNTPVLGFDSRTVLENFQLVGSETSRAIKMPKFLDRFNFADFGIIADALINFDSSFGCSHFLDCQSHDWQDFTTLIYSFLNQNFLTFYYK